MWRDQMKSLAVSHGRYVYWHWTDSRCSCFLRDTQAESDYSHLRTGRTVLWGLGHRWCSVGFGGAECSTGRVMRSDQNTTPSIAKFNPRHLIRQYGLIRTTKERYAIETKVVGNMFLTREYITRPIVWSASNWFSELLRLQATLLRTHDFLPA